MDTFQFYGKKGETVKVHLDADPPGAASGKIAILTLMGKLPRGRLSKTDASSLPNDLAVKLPATDKYFVSVAEQKLIRKTKRYKGACCVTLQATGETNETFGPSDSVE